MDNKIAQLIMLIILLCVIVIGCNIGHKITLVSHSKVYIVNGLDDIASSKNLIRILNEGERVEVLDCVDTKHYFVAKVRLPDRREGYVAQGSFIFGRIPACNLQQGTVIFSFCPW
jgi:hypothetical protein